MTHETYWISTGEGRRPKGGGTGYAARVPVHNEEKEREETEAKSSANGKSRPNDYDFLPYLTGIAYLARKGMIELYSSAELIDEREFHPPGRYRGYSYFDYSLLQGIEMPSIDGNVRWSVFGSPVTLPQKTTKQLLAEHLAAAQARMRNSGDQLFHQIFNVLGNQLGNERCDKDSWHIRTAERNNLFCFLTSDWPLLDACETHRNKAPFKMLKTKVMSPRDLGKYLEIRPVAPRLLSYDSASFFVHADLSSPKSMREPRRRRQ
ncbi:hypothetical protein [Parasphingorhabdus sp.]|uniref:hypothetical protein n=1 Tax=Parasphingorhabdus sp. TaxID=2709688 RepID=UPI003A9483E6